MSPTPDRGCTSDSFFLLHRAPPQNVSESPCAKPTAHGPIEQICQTNHQQYLLVLRMHRTTLHCVSNTDPSACTTPTGRPKRSFRILSVTHGPQKSPDGHSRVTSSLMQQHATQGDSKTQCVHLANTSVDKNTRRPWQHCRPVTPERHASPSTDPRLSTDLGLGR